ncbi:hypothetical protein BD289DRAFT_440245 [Coniella lustricola]|uniref:Uncharacterized protein n=1 Tax=Coniella lustricola TaxID=2025994 RepID=A0A2T3A0W2_9PEZI|nr:hypothetical protein BD289DRAFT_440245 [Coniella lustricola]
MTVGVAAAIQKLRPVPNSLMATSGIRPYPLPSWPFSYSRFCISLWFDSLLVPLPTDESPPAFYLASPSLVCAANGNSANCLGPGSRNQQRIVSLLDRTIASVRRIFGDLRCLSPVPPCSLSHFHFWSPAAVFSGQFSFGCGLSTARSKHLHHSFCHSDLSNLEFVCCRLGTAKATCSACCCNKSCAVQH